MKTLRIRDMAKGLLWTCVVVLFVASSLVIASCQEKQEIAQSRNSSVRNLPDSPREQNTATEHAILSVTESSEETGSLEGSVDESAPEETPEETGAQAASQEPAPALEYEIASGDNLWALSLRFYHTHVYWKLLAEWNGIEDPAGLRAGQTLKIPPVTEFPHQLYLVREGDNLTAISNVFYGSGDHWERLAEVNGLNSANRIQAGMILKIPAREVAAAPPADEGRLASE